MFFSNFQKMLKDLIDRGISYQCDLEIIKFNELVKKNFNKIFLVNITTSRIGHLAPGAEECLKNIFLNYNYYIKNKYCIIFVFPENKDDICNLQLYKMVKRTIPVIEEKEVIKFFQTLHEFDNELWDFSILNKYNYSCVHDFQKFNSTPLQLRFNNEEIEKGEELLKSLKIEEKKYICFHNRDSAYLKLKYDSLDYSSHDNRNSNIANYIDAIKTLIDKKGYSAVRMGDKVEDTIEFNSEKIINFTGNSRNDFGDIYISSKCKFFLGSCTGIIQIPQIFSVPVVITNSIPFGLLPFGKNDLYIPKKLWYIEEKRFLTFKEQVNSKICQWGLNGYNYKKLGIEVIENSKEEILDVSEEMDSRIDGLWLETDYDIELQNRVWNLFDESCIYAYNFKSKMGSKFLRDNEYLIGDR